MSGSISRNPHVISVPCRSLRRRDRSQPCRSDLLAKKSSSSRTGTRERQS